MAVASKVPASTESESMLDDHAQRLVLEEEKQKGNQDQRDRRLRFWRCHGQGCQSFLGLIEFENVSCDIVYKLFDRSKPMQPLLLEHQ